VGKKYKIVICGNVKNIEELAEVMLDIVKEDGEVIIDPSNRDLMDMVNSLAITYRPYSQSISYDVRVLLADPDSDELDSIEENEVVMLVPDKGTVFSGSRTMLGPSLTHIDEDPLFNGKQSLVTLAALADTKVTTLFRHVYGKSYYGHIRTNHHGIIPIMAYLKLRGVHCRKLPSNEVECYTDVESIIASNRIPNFLQIELPTLLSPPPSVFSNLLNDSTELDKAIDCIKSVTGKIVVVTDSDADGVLSAALGDRYFNDYTEFEVVILVNERKHGNGVNDFLVSEILKIDDVGVVITADHGSSDDDRYAILKENGIDVIVTDHHELPDTGRPINVVSFINPQDNESTLCTGLSGCAVLYYLLMRYQSSVTGAINPLLPLLPYVAISLVSDLMPMDNLLVRFLFKQGMGQIVSNFAPYDAMKEDIINTKNLDVKELYVSEMLLSFNFINYVNAANRMGNANIAYKFLTTTNLSTAVELYGRLKTINSKKKSIVNKLSKEVEFQDVENCVIGIIDTEYDGLLSLVGNRYLDERPVFMFTLIDGVYKGSTRNPMPDINIAEVMSKAKSLGGAVIKSGGHQGAGGLVVSDVNMFATVVDKLIPGVVKGQMPQFDIDIGTMDLNHNLAISALSLSPFGNSFHRPRFKIDGVCGECRFMGSFGYMLSSEDRKNPIWISKWKRKAPDNALISIVVEVGVNEIGELEYRQIYEEIL